MTVDLARWIGDQLNADERIARAAIEDEFLTCGRWLARGPYGDDDRYGSIQSELNEQIIEDDLPWSFTEHAAEHDPARVLREIDAKREIVELHHAELVEVTNADREERSGYWCFECDGEPFPCRTLRLHALPYADRPGYAEAVASIK